MKPAALLTSPLYSDAPPADCPAATEAVRSLDLAALAYGETLGFHNSSPVPIPLERTGTRDRVDVGRWQSGRYGDNPAVRPVELFSARPALPIRRQDACRLPHPRGPGRRSSDASRRNLAIPGRPRPSGPAPVETQRGGGAIIHLTSAAP